MKKIFWLIYQPYKWLIFTPILGLSAMIFAILAITLSILVSPKIGSLVGGIGWSRICAFFTPMSVTLSGKQHIDRNQSYVVVSNHQSHYDIFAVYGWLMMDLKWVMKKELRKVPFVGYACEKVGHIIIDRSDRKKAIQELNRAKQNIVDGTSVMFFPEGTRSKDGSIAPFKKGAFIMALQLGLPILPITIKGTRKILPSGSFNLLPGKAEVVIHPPIDINRYSEGDLEHLIEDTRSIIASSFQ